MQSSLRNLQENICHGESSFSFDIREILQGTFLTEHLRATAFGNMQYIGEVMLPPLSRLINLKLLASWW